MKHQKHQFREHLCNSSHCSLICFYLVGPKSQSQVSLAVLIYKYFYTVFQCQDGDIYFQDVVIDKYFDPSIPKIFFSPAYPGELFMRLLKLMILPLIIARFAKKNSE